MPLTSLTEPRFANVRSLASMGAIALVITALPTLGFAQSPATPAPRESVEVRSDASVVVVTGEEIDQRQWRTLVEVLENQPGIHVRQQGGVGQWTQLFFRGQRAGRVLVRLDGIEISDPLDDDPGAVVPELLMVDIDRIELRRGPDSVLFGSDAVGGVIDIYTRRGSGAMTPEARFEGGSFGTTLGTLGVSGGGSLASYQLSFSNLNTKGVSARRRDLGGRERDDYKNDTLQARLDLEPSEALSLSLSGRFVHSQLDIDAFGIANPDLLGLDPDILDENDARQLFLRASGELRLFDDRWIQRFSAGYTGHDRAGGPGSSVTQVSGFLNGGFRSFSSSDSDSTRLKLAWENEIRWAPEHTLRLGAETERESIDQSSVTATSFSTSTSPLALLGLNGTGVNGTSVIGGAGTGLTGTGVVTTPAPSALSFATGAVAASPISFSTSTSTSRSSLHGSARNYAVYAQEEFQFERLAGAVGVRLQDQDDFGSRLGYRAALSYLVPATGVRLFASIGTGSRDPSLVNASRATFTSVSDTGGFVGGAPLLSSVSFAPSPLVLTNTLLPPPPSEPEVIRGIEVGLAAPLPSTFGSLRVVYFRSRTRGISDQSFGVAGVNGQLFPVRTGSIQARAQGVEASARLELSSSLQLGLDYTYTSSEVRHTASPIIVTALRDARTGTIILGRTSGEDELGIPKHLLAASLVYTPTSALELVFGARYVGEREDAVGFGARSLGGFTTFDLALGYRLRDNLKLFGRVENLFDKDFHDPFEANGPERAGYVGVELAY